MATIQKPIVDTIIEPKLELIDKITGETLDVISNFLKKTGIPFDYLPDYLRKPTIYYGTSIGLKQIIEWFIDITVSKYYFEIQAEGLPVKFVINTIRKNLFQGGWDVKRYSNITVATRGEEDARKAVSTSRIDESPRLLIVKNKARKIRSKPKSISNSKKKIKQVRTYRKGRKGSCAYCGTNAKPRARNTTHINIRQNPTHHHFCSKECKTMWIYALLNKKINLEMV